MAESARPAEIQTREYGPRAGPTEERPPRLLERWSLALQLYHCFCRWCCSKEKQNEESRVCQALRLYPHRAAAAPEQKTSMERD